MNLHVTRSEFACFWSLDKHFFNSAIPSSFQMRRCIGMTNLAMNESFQDKLKLLFSFVFVDAAVINALFVWYTYMDINE